MNKQAYKIHIIGGGVSGLIAAQVLEENGYTSTIIEATDRVGGRVKTDMVDNYPLDHGFQVLLTAYPSARKYLDFTALDLQYFLPGAAIFKNKKQVVIGDPLRNISLLFPTILSGIGNFSDKVKILQLNAKLKTKSISNIFLSKEQTTLSYLKDKGFSSGIINDFFIPFFSGIFLEKELQTSSRMFEFVYKMFGEGFASVPKTGMEAIPKQLKQKLSTTNFEFNAKVKEVKEQEIILEDGTIRKSDFTIVATAPNTLLQTHTKKPVSWKSCTTLYFETEERTISKNMIGLISDSGTLVNTIVYVNPSSKISSGKELLSVTVVDNQGIVGDKLVQKVTQELATYCSLKQLKFVKQYEIPRALPHLPTVAYEKEVKKVKFSERLFLAGDTMLNGSLNAAMISGETAAHGVIQTIEALQLTN
ncbi:NAD(P)/FAD-dependent oxidoreductase [Tenacibaculum sp. SG-28]|uniref:NAD(P)/FAD-dependent oxidoreductase n=1 Tax=Tenacibaculum sp. SG-28 TaxID=754426 RepID=UPI000CF44F98|nr:NAD(P)/FAD-dependent oxidoreductase [Tenacibaculum sp. SG-28]PQJ23416.1 oxidoreductase [Tenacibaculum sp. SG-28]